MAGADDDKFLRAVKLFNVVAGVLLIAGTITLIVALFVRNSGDEEEVADDQAVPLSEGEAIALRTLPGSRILDAELDDGLLLVTTESAEGARQIFILDPKSGTVREIKAGQD